MQDKDCTISFIGEIDHLQQTDSFKRKNRHRVSKQTALPRDKRGGIKLEDALPVHALT